MTAPLSISKDLIKGYECRHATYTASKDGKHDLLTIKEYIHLHDGTRIPNVRLIKDFKRPFWITNNSMRTNKDLMEWDKLDNLIKYESTQVELVANVARALKKFNGPNTTLKTLADTHFLYGTDITSTSLIKETYKRKFPNCITPYATVAAFDIETDIVHGHGDIICASVTFGGRAFLGVNSNWLARTNEAKIHAAFEKYIGKWLPERNIQLVVEFFDNPADLVVANIERMHEWKPDFVSIWNMNFDLKKVEETLRNHKYDIDRIMSDPTVPKEFAKWHYKEGKTQKVTQSGKVMGLHPADRWHIATNPASFYFIDAMCLYKRIRIAEGMVSSYGLDATLKRHLNVGKLNFAEVDKLEGTAWHKEMQTNYKVEYCIYNIFDNIGQELLDEKVGDISKAFPVLVGVSDYDKFTSNPRRIVDDLHYFCLDRNMVIAATPEHVSDELDKYVIGVDNWIVTLDAYMMSDTGLNLIADAPSLHTMIFDHCADLDVEGTYPNVEMIANISKETTYREMATIFGLTEKEQRKFGINLTAGKVNAVELCTMAFNLPNFEQMESFYLAQKNN